MTTPPRRPSAAARAARRSRRAAPSGASYLERNRNRLLVGAGAIVFAILAGLAFFNASQPAYACSMAFDPTPAPSQQAPTPAPVASGATAAPASPPPPGYVQPDMGNVHAGAGTRVRYANCPPASGRHFSGAGIGPIRAGVYGPDEAQVPQGWVHNLEHGAIVLLYNCGPDGDPAACTDPGQAALESLYARWPASPVCNIPAGAGPAPVIARFDDMEFPYAAIVWDVVLPMDTIDETALFDFYARQGERFNPEQLCPAPTPTPGPATPTANPTSTAAPSAAPTTAPTAPSAAPTTAAS